ncbi:MAG TPA: sodium:solute symporter family protein [Firmicutes bacterium]|nr:sodium:solute symporter family protein [Bacillota bacterium]
MGSKVTIMAFIIYLGLMLYIGYWGMKKSSGAEGYYVANRQCGKWLSVGTFAGSFISAVAVIGYTGSGYATGYVTLVNVLGCVLSFYCIYFLFCKTIKNRFDNLCTIPEIFQYMYDSKAMLVISAFITVCLNIALLVSQIKGGSLICTSILGVSYETALILISGVFILYTVMGGMYSVVYTDLIQTGILVFGILLAFPFVISKVGGFSAMQTAIAQVNPTAFDPIGVAGGPLGVFSTILSFSLGIAASQYYLIRIYSAKDLSTAKFMVAASCAIWTVVGIILVFLGVASRVLMPDLATADSAIIELAGQLPPVIQTMLLIGLACAIMSTTDTILLVAGTYVGRDLYKALINPNASDDQTVSMTRKAVCVVGIIAAVLALNPPELIISLTTFTTSVSAATFFAPMLLGFFWKKTTTEGALVGTILGGVSAVLWQLFSPIKIPAAFASVGISFIAVFLVSILGPKDNQVRLPVEHVA